MTSYYLDTSVQIERWFGSAQSRERITEVLGADGECSTSSHVRREWKHVVDQSAVDMLNVLTSDDPQDDLPRLAQGHGRSANRRMLVLFNVMKNHRGAAWTREELRARARQMVEFRSDEMFSEGITTVRDTSECGLARAEHFTAPGGHYGLKTTCRRDEDICRQPDAIEDDLDTWEAGAAALGHVKRYESMGEAGLKMASKKPDRKGKNCYEKTGDLSVALGSAPGETIVTTDASFEVIGPAIGRQVRKLPPTAQPPKPRAE